MIRYSVLAVFAVACAIAGWDAVAAEPAAAGGPASAELAELSLEELMDVEISVASKRPETTFEAPGVVVVVPRQEIELYGDRTLFQLMQRQPSVYPRRSCVFADNVLSFRGDASSHWGTHTLILLNGRPIRESGHGINSAVSMTFPLASLESLELIRGPGSVLYGTNAVTGVIDLRTRPVPEQREISVSALGGSYGTYDTTITGGGTFGEVGFIGSLRIAGQDGWPYRLTDANGVYAEKDKKDQSVSALAHLEYRGFTLDVFGTEMDAFVLGVQPLWADANQDIRIKRLFVNAGYRTPVHERMTLEFNLTSTYQRLSMFNPFTPRVDANTLDSLAEITLYANPTDELNIVVGALQEYRTNYDVAGDHFEAFPRYEYWPRSAYAQADYTIGGVVKLIGGTQWNESPQGDSDVISRIGAVVTPDQHWGLKLLRGEAFRGPIAVESDIYDPLVIIGNDELSPETVTTYDAQLFYHDEKTYAALTYFESTFDDQILNDSSHGFPLAVINGGEQRFDGIEVEGKRFINANWHVLGSLMRYDCKAGEVVEHSIAPKTMWKLGTGYTWNWGSAAVFLTHFGKPPVLPSPFQANPEPEAVDLLSVNVRLDVSEWIGLTKGQSFLTLRGENLLDEEVYVPMIEDRSVPNSFPYGPGRTLYLGMEVSF